MAPFSATACSKASWTLEYSSLRDSCSLTFSSNFSLLSEISDSKDDAFSLTCSNSAIRSVFFWVRISICSFHSFWICSDFWARSSCCDWRVCWSSRFCFSRASYFSICCCKFSLLRRISCFLISSCCWTSSKDCWRASFSDDEEEDSFSSSATSLVSVVAAGKASKWVTFSSKSVIWWT